MIEGPISAPPGPGSRRPSRTPRPRRARPPRSRRRSARAPRGRPAGRPRLPPGRPGRRRGRAAAAASASRARSCSARVPTSTATEPARQRCPPAPKAEDMIAGHGQVEVGVGHHDQRVLRPAERLEALAVGARALGDVARGRGLADERDRVDLAGGRAAPLTASWAPWTRLSDARRELRSTESISSKISSEGRGSRSDGLRMKRVAAGDREGQEPERDHRREVERGDRRDHADRLAPRARRRRRRRRPRGSRP